MKRLSVVSLAVSLILSASLCFAQISATVPKLPDYAQWGESVDVQKYHVILNGKDINISANLYLSINKAATTVRRQSVNILNNEQNKPWLARYLDIVYVLNSHDSFSLKESHLYLFENKDGKWIFVEDFSKERDDQNLYKLLGEKYNLEFGI